MTCSHIDAYIHEKKVDFILLIIIQTIQLEMKKKEFTITASFILTRNIYDTVCKQQPAAAP